MTMLTQDDIKRIASGTPDVTSGEFRSAVAAVKAWIRVSKNEGTLEWLEGLQSALLAHGEPVAPRKPTKEELSAIRREASARGLVARSRLSLAKKAKTCRSGIVGVSEKQPAVFDAALEMIEDGEMVCTHFATAPSPNGEVRSLTIAWAAYVLPSWAVVRECPWKSKRRQVEERI